MNCVYKDPDGHQAQWSDCLFFYLTGIITGTKKYYFIYNLLNTPSACGGVNTRKRGLGETTCSPKYKLDIVPL
jgi:hypothetical protein